MKKSKSGGGGWPVPKTYKIQVRGGGPSPWTDSCAVKPNYLERLINMMGALRTNVDGSWVQTAGVWNFRKLISEERKYQSQNIRDLPDLNAIGRLWPRLCSTFCVWLVEPMMWRRCRWSHLRFEAASKNKHEIWARQSRLAQPATGPRSSAVIKTANDSNVLFVGGGVNTTFHPELKMFPARFLIVPFPRRIDHQCNLPPWR